MEKLIFFLMQGIPETIALLALCLAFVGASLRWKVIIPAAIVLALIIYVVREVQLSFGLHTVIMTLLIALFLVKVTKATLLNSLIASFAELTLLITYETIVSSVFFALTKLDPQAVMMDKWLWLMLGLPQIVLMFFTVYIVTKVKKPSKAIWRFGLEEEVGMQ